MEKLLAELLAKMNPLKSEQKILEEALKKQIEELEKINQEIEIHCPIFKSKAN